MGWLSVDENARDICYKNLMGNGDWSQDARVYLERLYLITSDILDKKFQQQAKANLNSCFAEMYFAAVCRERLSLCISHPSDEGLDFYLDALNCWVECVVPTHGNFILAPENSVPSFEPGIAYNFPERQFLLRLSSVFIIKSQKIIEDIKKGLVLESQPVVLFVSAGAMHDRYSFYIHPPMFNVLLGFGSMSIIIDKKTGKAIANEYENKDIIEKFGAEANIEIGYFFELNHSHVSAVIYSWADFANARKQSELGSDFFMLHNPLAKNKLPHGSFACGKEFYVDMSSEPYSIVKYKYHDVEPM